MANAVEASASTARPRKLKKGQRRVKRQQQEGTEPSKGTVRERKTSRLPKNELLTGTLEHRHQPQYQPYRIRAQTREGRYRERSTRRRRASEGARNDGRVADCQADRRTPKCSRRGGKRERKKREEWPLIRPPSAKTGRMKGHKSWRGGDHGSRTGVVDWRANVAQVID